jgi:tellurite resistance protein TehA-like permease
MNGVRLALGPRLRTEVFGGEAVRRLYPGHFALVMATGIVSTALRDDGRSVLPAALLVIATCCFVVLVVASAVRLARYPREVIGDLSRPDRAYVFFTTVAACGVVGTAVAAYGLPLVALVLGALGFLVWLVLSYVIPLRLILGPRPRPRPVLAGLDGTWFIWVVGTQSMAVTAAVLGAAYPAEARPAALVAVVLWSVGVMLYLIVATLMLLRLLLLDVRPGDLTAPYWITMGATAISVLAAARILRIPHAPAVNAARQLLTGLAFVLWSFGTWLIPMLILFGGCRYALRRVRPGYRPHLWSAVFPLGMYAAAGMEFGRAASLPIVERIGRLWVWVAFAVWAVTFAALVCSRLGPRTRLTGMRTVTGRAPAAVRDETMMDRRVAGDGADCTDGIGGTEDP